MAICGNKGAPKPTEIMQHANLQGQIQVVSCINKGAEHLYFPPNTPRTAPNPLPLPRSRTSRRDQTKVQKCYV